MILRLHKYKNLGTPNFFFLITEIYKKIWVYLKQILNKLLLIKSSMKEVFMMDVFPLALELGILIENKSKFFIAKDFISYLKSKQFL